MKVPLSWLQEYISITLSPEKIAEGLTSLGLEVDAILQRELPFENVVVCKVLDVKPHPSDKRLHVATIFDGQHNFQVVCGAMNCHAGMIAAYAKVGAVVRDSEGKILTIKKTHLQNVESVGMLCSADELGLASSRDGTILEIDPKAKEGTDVKELYAETIFEISLTPNLGHNLSMFGIARELSAKFSLPLKFPSTPVPEDAAHSIQKTVKLDVESKDLCTQYACRLIKGVRLGPSPAWLRTRLEAAGQKSINNLVDIGNYVMLETGQPLHFFDAEKIEGHHILVKQAKKEESIELLDGTTCKIPEGTLLICDPKKTLAIAGIMGGKTSAIHDTTTQILIESACFSPPLIRRTSKNLGLRTEASYRFERGTDPEGVLFALERASSLALQIAGGTAMAGIQKFSTPFIPKKILCRVPRLNAFLGTSLSQNEVIELFKRLFMTVAVKDNDRLEVTVPSFRNDLAIEEDLFEEVARLYGYHNIPKTQGRHVSSPICDAPLYTFEETIRTQLIGEGLQECITCDLISPTEARLTLERGMSEESLIQVLHPSSADQSVLRPSLLPAMLKVARFNQDHGTSDLSLFEIGKIHYREEGHFKERLMAAIALKGKAAPYHFSPKTPPVDFFDLKGLIENLLISIKAPSAQFDISHLHSFHPFRQAKILIGENAIGAIGQVHPETLALLEIKEPVFFAEIDLMQLSLLAGKNWKYAAVPPYPGSERDWTLTIKNTFPVSGLLAVAKSAASPFLNDIFLLDIYESEQLGKDKKNVTLRFFYLDKEQTIEQATVDREHAKLKEQVAEKLKDYVL